MRILLLAPQPCYVDRGTPIAVDLTMAMLAEEGHQVDLLTFPGGEDRHYDGLRTFRVGEWVSKTPARAGLSAKKLFFDLLMLGKAIRLALKNRYTLVHAVEESTFIALVLRILFRIPYLNDMDSRMTTQITDRYTWLRPFDRALWFVESLPTRFAGGVVAMCESLRTEVLKIRQDNVFVVKDVSLLDYYGDEQLSVPTTLTDIRQAHNNVLMYIGNLETYQGIQLMLESFAEFLHNPQHGEAQRNAALVIVGGDAERIAEYRAIAGQLNIASHCYFLGPQPVAMLPNLMRQADVMLSPRIQGTNTPLKLYSYLDSGVPVLATNLATHTQVVDAEQAMLCEPSPQAMAAAMAQLTANKELREQFAANAKALIQKHYSLAVFRREMMEIYRVLVDAKVTSPSSTEAA